MSKRISKVAQCIRKSAATSRIPRSLMPDSDKFDASQITPEMSIKFTEVIQNIQKLDKEDQEKHGTLYKHFIFTDIRESAYGAKAFASFLIAAGFDFRMEATANGRTIYTHKPAVEGGCNGFAMLQSLPLWKKPLSVWTKREILDEFNSRPQNVNGELLRIIVLDSKYKEGIDLFDVKYAHLLEPTIAASDLKQAVGRATRYCGQKGLPFTPRRGWKLIVYIYSTILPARHPFLLKDVESDTDPVNAHTFMMIHSGLDLALLNLTKELTMLGIMTSVDYDLNYKINNFSVESAVLDAVEDIDEMVILEVEQTKTKTNTSQSKSKSKELLGVMGGNKKLAGIYRPEDIDDKLLHKCSHGRKSKLFPFTKVSMHKVAQEMGIKVPKSSKRGVYCNLLRSNPHFLDKLFARESAVFKDVQHMFDQEDKRKQKRPSVHTIVPVNRFTPAASSLSPSASSLLSSPPSPLSPSLLSRSSASPSSRSSTSMTMTNPLTQLHQLPPDEFQKGVMEIYRKYKWDSPIVKNGCENTQIGKPGTAVSFTHTQDFVRHYLTPDSPFKGLLAWHSVGTGKTCMAVAAATTQFEQAGYTILWVTRNALMADMYKNIFGSVCSIPIAEKLKDGETLPSHLVHQKRMLSRAWMAPISYRTFQNALEENNELGRMLHRNNPGDPLRKTFLVMDEIHKLQDGDLGAAEAADFSVVQDFIYKSYARSGTQSVRPLFMTATPITDNPKELFEILNTLIPSESRRFMPFQDFRERYTSTAGEINDEGKTYFQERAKGLISYLNREFDPTTFSQPEFHTVSVPLASENVPTAETMVDACMQNITVDVANMEKMKDCSTFDSDLTDALAKIDARQLPPKERKKAVQEINQTIKRGKRECEKHNRSVKRVYSDILKTAAQHYKEQQRDFIDTHAGSQVMTIESCLTGEKLRKKDVRALLPDKKNVMEEIEKRLRHRQPQRLRQLQLGSNVMQTRKSTPRQSNSFHGPSGSGQIKMNP